VVVTSLVVFVFDKVAVSTHNVSATLLRNAFARDGVRQGTTTCIHMLVVVLVVVVLVVLVLVLLVLL